MNSEKIKVSCERGCESMADANTSAYTGKIKNQGSQTVQAPHQSTPSKTGKVQRGSDLRTGKKK